MGDISTAMQISAAGLRAQSGRLRIVAENLANANSTASASGLDPYRRQVPIFSSYMDRDAGAQLVEISRVSLDPSQFNLRYDPSHPVANEEGFVAFPNVNPLVEMMDLREAQRSYEANLGAMETMRAIASSTLRILE